MLYSFLHIIKAEGTFFWREFLNVGDNVVLKRLITSIYFGTVQ